MADCIQFFEFFFRQYGLVALPIAVSLIVMFYSNHYSRKTAERSAQLANDANNKAQEANELAKEAIKKSEKQFVETNRPQLTAEPILLQNSNSYYEIRRIDDTRFYAALYVVVQNKGNVIASSAIIEEATFQVGYSGARIAYKRNYYDGLGKVYSSKEDVPKMNFTLIDVQPGTSFARKLEFILDLVDIGNDIDRIFQAQSDLAITINLRLSCAYELLEGKQFVTHTSHAITKTGVTTLENRLGVYDIQSS